MNVIVRVDSSQLIGMGHLMRCLTLAETLRNEKAIITFICRDLPGNLSNLVVEKGFSLIKLNYDNSVAQKLESLSEHKQWLGASIHTEITDMCDILQNHEKADLLVVDHYALDEQWESQMRCYTKKIMVIDDLADRKHDCDILLDQNFFINPLERYKSLIPESCKLLLGPNYALLREEFVGARRSLKSNKEKLNKFVISMGGSDPRGLTVKFIDILFEYKIETKKEFKLRVIVGPANQNIKQIDLYSNREHIEIIHSPSNMAEHFLWADLCLGTSGSTNWERCALGLPAIVVIDGDNEREIAENSQDAGFLFAHENDDCLQDSIIECLKGLSNKKLKIMSKLAMNVTDAHGAEKVAKLIREEVKEACQIQ